MWKVQGTYCLLIWAVRRRTVVPRSKNGDPWIGSRRIVSVTSSLCCKKNPQKVKMMKFFKNKTLDKTISRIFLTTRFGYTHCQEIQGETLQLLYLFATWMNALGSQQRASALVARWPIAILSHWGQKSRLVRRRWIHGGLVSCRHLPGKARERDFVNVLGRAQGFG